MESLAKSVVRACMRRMTRGFMKSAFWSFSTILCLLMGQPALAQDPARANPTDPQPTCTMCPGTYIPSDELDGYARKRLRRSCWTSRCGISISARRISASAWSTAAGWRNRLGIQSPNMTRSAKSIVCCPVQRRWCWAPIFSIGSVARPRCARSSNSMVLETTAPRFATASPKRSRPATLS
jgi:hypothetical protein